MNKELAELTPKLSQPAGGRGGAGGDATAAGTGRGSSATENLMTRAAQAKNGLMGGMWPGEQTTKAYNDMKTKFRRRLQTPTR